MKAGNKHLSSVVLSERNNNNNNNIKLKVKLKYFFIFHRVPSFLHANTAVAVSMVFSPQVGRSDSCTTVFCFSGLFFHPLLSFLCFQFWLVATAVFISIITLLY